MRVHSTWASGARAIAVPWCPDRAACGASMASPRMTLMARCSRSRAVTRPPYKSAGRPPVGSWSGSGHAAGHPVPSEGGRPGSDPLHESSDPRRGPPLLRRARVRRHLPQRHRGRRGHPQAQPPPPLPVEGGDLPRGLRDPRSPTGSCGSRWPGDDPAQAGWEKMEFVLDTAFDWFSANPEFVRIMRREALDGTATSGSTSARSSSPSSTAPSSSSTGRWGSGTSASTTASS